ncbi:hypothetical protein PIB30_009701 [Stylosanthes scabra]|uniref:Uncharacterized protein n=1 Tax=Stylosanthes scabra TaxID=79078 RepID=A0ABU6V4B2_9FABA|nr:hypothetical protein [Stylosanthes scabra]
MGVIKKQSSSSELDNNNLLPFNTFLFDGGGETQQNDDDCLEDTMDDEADECGIGNCESVSCSEDESDNENNKEFAAQEQEESDENLKTRIENFIAKVYKGWSDESCLDRDIL